jgi:hypothetical protein
MVRIVKKSFEIHRKIGRRKIMIKGAQKKMIVLKTSDSAVFEEAYFVLRRESRDFDEDMVREANRIIEDGGGRRSSKRKRISKGWIYGMAGFLSGACFGGGIAALIILV